MQLDPSRSCKKNEQHCSSISHLHLERTLGLTPRGKYLVQYQITTSRDWHLKNFCDMILYWYFLIATISSPCCENGVQLDVSKKPAGIGQGHQAESYTSLQQCEVQWPPSWFFVAKRKRPLLGENLVTVAIATNANFRGPNNEHCEHQCKDPNEGLYWHPIIDYC